MFSSVFHKNEPLLQKSLSLSLPKDDNDDGDDGDDDGNDGSDGDDGDDDNDKLLKLLFGLLSKWASQSW